MKIINLDVDALLSGDTKIEEIGLVFNPAIEVDWVYFNSQEQELKTYNKNTCNCSIQHEFNENDDMIQGIIDILVEVEDIENRAQIAIDVLKQFEKDGIEYDYQLFLERIGLDDPDLDYLFDETTELEDLLDMGYEITQAREINPSEVMSEYQGNFNSQNITEEQFYKLTSNPNEPSLLDSSFRLRRYVYSIGTQGGPDLIPTSREFCRRMLGKRQLVWRFEDLQLLSAQLNAEDSDRKIIPRPKGANIDVFSYAGGANCRHRWLELSLDPGDRVVNNKQRAQKNATIILDAPGQSGQINEPVQYGRTRNPDTLRQETLSKQDIPVGFIQGVPVYKLENDAIDKSKLMGCEGVFEEIDYRGEKCYRPCRTKKKDKYSDNGFEFKFNEEKKIIYAPAMIPNKLMRRYDEKEGEFFVRFSREAIQRGAYKFLAEGRTSPNFVNYEHSDKKFNDIFLVESWIVGDDEDKIYNYGFTKDDVPAGSWIVGYKVENDDLWENYVKKGLVKAVSVEGLFDMSFKSDKVE